MATGSAGVGRCDPYPRDSRLVASNGKVPQSDMGRMDRHEDARDQGWGIAMGTQRSLGWDRWTWARLVGFR